MHRCSNGKSLNKSIAPGHWPPLGGRDSYKHVFHEATGIWTPEERHFRVAKFGDDHPRVGCTNAILPFFAEIGVRPTGEIGRSELWASRAALVFMQDSTVGGSTALVEQNRTRS